MVLAVADTVAVRIRQGTTVAVDWGACGCPGAEVLFVVDAVAVTVLRQGAAIAIDRGAGRGVGAEVVSVRHAIIVAVLADLDWETRALAE